MFPTNKPQQTIEQQIGINQTIGVECANCGGVFFQQHILIRRIPRVLIAAPTDQYSFIPVFRCSDCHEVAHEFMPDGLDLGSNTDQKPAPFEQTNKTIIL
jgi:hypothetical protein